MKKPFILGINGSPHTNGIVVRLIKLVLRGAEKSGGRTELIHLYKCRIAPTPGLYSKDPEFEIIKRMPKDDMRKIYRKIGDADGLVLGTPAYWANMSGVMKNFIDRLTPMENKGFQLGNKVAVFIAASKENEGGIEMAAMSMVTALLQMGICIPPLGVMWYPPGEYKNQNGKNEAWAFSDAPIVGKNMVALAKFLKTRRFKWK